MGTINIGESNIANLTVTPNLYGLYVLGSQIKYSPTVSKAGSITPTSLSADQNNYNPTGLSTAQVINLAGDSSFRTITGLTAQPDGTTIDLINVGTNTILLADETGKQGQDSTAANRFAFNGHDVPIFPKNDIPIMYSANLSRWIIVHRQAPIIPNRKNGFYTGADYFSAQAENTFLFTAASGGSTSNQAGTVGHPGFRAFTLGTSTTGSATTIPNANNLLLGNSWYWRFDMILKLTALSDGTNTYTLRVGFIDSGTAESTDGAFFRYTNGVNSGKWERVTRNNTTETATDTTVTAQTTNPSLFTVIVNPAGSNAEFFIDGVSKGSNTANIPTGAGRETSFGMMFLKSAGTTDNEALRIDMFEVIGYAPVMRTT